MILTVYDDLQFGPSVWAEGDRMDEAREDLQKSAAFWADTEDTKTAENMKNRIATLRTMDEEQFNKEIRAFYIDRPAKEITESEFYEMMDCLPPLRFTDRGFQMRERMTLTFTAEYYRENGKFFCHFVDLADKTTWKI